MAPKRRGVGGKKSATSAVDATSSVQSRTADPPPAPRPPSLTSKRHLAVETVLPGQIFLVPGFFTSSEAAAVQRSLEERGLTPTPPPPPAQAHEYAVRNMKRCSFESQEYVDVVWERSGLGTLLAGVELGLRGGRGVVGLNPNVRGYRYDVGDRFGRHYDGAYDVSERCGGESEGERREGRLRTVYTALVYLGNEELEGGETVFWIPDSSVGAALGDAGGERVRKAKQKKQRGNGRRGAEEDVGVEGMREVVVAPRRGTLLLHRHGEECLLHEGRRVTRGSKYVLRTDLVARLPCD